MEMSCIPILKKEISFFFSFTKSDNRRAEKVLSEGVGTSGRREEVGKRLRRVNMV
jgi:hypothetical protein